MFIPSSTHRRKVNGFDCWQEKVGKWLGFVSIVNVFDNPVLTEEECTLITIALEHRQLGLSHHSFRGGANRNLAFGNDAKPVDIETATNSRRRR